jgi:hypothetical protein
MWEPGRGATFLTFALPWVRWAIQKGRDRRYGVNWRCRRDSMYESPLSLDAELNDDGWTLADELADDDTHGNFRRCPSVESVLPLLSEAEAIAILNPAVEAAEMLGLKKTSVLTKRVRAYDRVRRVVAA